MGDVSREAKIRKLGMIITIWRVLLRGKERARGEGKFREGDKGGKREEFIITLVLRNTFFV